MKPGAMQFAVTLRLAYSCGGGLDHAGNAGFGGNVIRLPRIARDPYHRRDRDDAAEAAAHHAAHRGPRQAEGGGQVDRDHLLPILVAQLHQQIIARHAGIGDQHVELPHRFLGAGDQGIDGGGIGEIARQNMDAAAKLAGERIERVDARAGERHVSRLAHEGRARCCRRWRRSLP